MIQVLGLDHIALYVANVPLSVHFYQDVLGLKPLPRPAFDFPGAWFDLGHGRQLHLLGDRTEPLPADTLGSRRNHFAFQVADLQAAADFLSQQGLPLKGPKPRPDGVRQLFFQDPDGYWIELNG